MIDKREIQQLTGIGTTQQMTMDEPKSEESNTPVEENKEEMWPEGGLLLMFMEKASQKQKQNTATEIQVTSAIEEPEGGTGSPKLFPKEDDKTKEELQKSRVADVSTPKDDGESSEKSQKPQVDSIVPTSSTSQHTVESVGAPMEEIVEENPLKLNMQEKLIKATNKLGGEVKSEENIQVLAIGLLLRIQAALDEQQIFPENSTVNILNIINKIPDKKAIAWQEKLKGETINNQQARALTDSLIKEQQVREQERKQQRQDIYITQKCVEILQNAAKTYEFTSKTASGLADLAGMCDDRTNFKNMMNVVVGLPTIIQQQAEMKIREAKEKLSGVYDKAESFNIKDLDQLIEATVLPRFDEEWEQPQYEPTEYLAVLFKYWLHRSMFPNEKPKIHQIAVKFRCSVLVLQGYIRGYVKPPSTQKAKTEQCKRKRVVVFEEESDRDEENMAPRRKLKLRKRKLQERLGVL